MSIASGVEVLSKTPQHLSALLLFACPTLVELLVLICTQALELQVASVAAMLDAGLQQDESVPVSGCIVLLFIARAGAWSARGGE